MTKKQERIFAKNVKQGYRFFSGDKFIGAQPTPRTALEAIRKNKKWLKFMIKKNQV